MPPLLAIPSFPIIPPLLIIPFLLAAVGAEDGLDEGFDDGDDEGDDDGIDDGDEDGELDGDAETLGDEVFLLAPIIIPILESPIPLPIVARRPLTYSKS
jgi:hypothetical protein